MPLFELRMVDAKQKMQQRIEKASGIVSGEIRGRFNGDDDEPKNQRDPSLECFVAVRTQAR